MNFLITAYSSAGRPCFPRRPGDSPSDRRAKQGIVSIAGKRSPRTIQLPPVTRSSVAFEELSSIDVFFTKLDSFLDHVSFGATSPLEPGGTPPW